MCRIGAIPTQTMLFDNYSLVVESCIDVTGCCPVIYHSYNSYCISKNLLTVLYICYLGIESHSSVSKKESSRNSGKN